MLETCWPASLADPASQLETVSGSRGPSLTLKTGCSPGRHRMVATAMTSATRWVCSRWNCSSCSWKSELRTQILAKSQASGGSEGRNSAGAGEPGLGG